MSYRIEWRWLTRLAYLSTHDMKTAEWDLKQQVESAARARDGDRLEALSEVCFVLVCAWGGRGGGVGR